MAVFVICVHTNDQNELNFIYENLRQMGRQKNWITCIESNQHYVVDTNDDDITEHVLQKTFNDISDYKFKLCVHEFKCT